MNVIEWLKGDREDILDIYTEDMVTVCVLRSMDRNRSLKPNVSRYQDIDGLVNVTKRRTGRGGSCADCAEGRQ